MSVDFHVFFLIAALWPMFYISKAMSRGAGSTLICYGYIRHKHRHRGLLNKRRAGRYIES